MYSICKGVNVITNEHHASFLQLNLLSGEIRTHKKNLVKICRKSWVRKTKKVRKKVENVLLLILEEVDSWPALLKPHFNLNYEQKHTAVQLGQVSLESYLNHLDWRKLSDTTQKCSLSLSLSPSRTSEVTMATLTAPFQYSMLGSNQLKHTIP